MAYLRLLCGLNFGRELVDCKAAEDIGNLAAEIDLGCQHIADAQLEIAERVKDIAANDHEFKEVTLARERLKAD